MGVLLLAFAGVLLLAVLLSSLAHRTILSTAALFLVAGFVLGDGALGVVSPAPDEELVGTLAELALFTIPFIPFFFLDEPWQLAFGLLPP